MRPRPEGRGEPSSASLSGVILLTLQCGHDPKAVENYIVQTFLRPKEIRLQCGHDPKAVENVAASGCHVASTPPLQCGHDPKAVENPLQAGHSAPSFHGFNAATTRRPWRTLRQRRRSGLFRRLQCGHDPKAVENDAAVATLKEEEKLQCGHDPKAVENADSPVPAEERRRASMRPRPEGRGERQLGDHGVRQLNLASMRPRPEGRGEPIAQALGPACLLDRFNAATTRRPWRTRVSGRFTRTWVGASMRPRPEGRGEQGGCQCRISGERRFNAATTRRPWRTKAGRDCGPMDVVVLQCGHDPKAVENVGLLAPEMLD